MSEWITDRTPTEDDIVNGCVWAVNEFGEVTMMHYPFVIQGTPWQPIPKPAPYVKPKRWTVEWNVDIWILLDHALERSYWCGLGELGRNGGDSAQRIADVFNEVLP